MALIGKIRQQKWLLVGSMAAALALFIAMLMFDNPNQSLFGGSRTLLGDIDGQKIEYQEFSQMHDMLYRGSSGDAFSERAYLWNFFVDEAILQKEAENIGIGVGKPELIDLQFSSDASKLSPVMSSRYVDPNTGQLDFQQINQMKDIITGNQIDQLIQSGQLVPDFKYRWAHQEKEIVKDRLQSKISRMVEKAMYSPSWMAEMVANEQNQKVDFLYVQVPFDEIENSEVNLSDDDFKAYLAENKNMFRQDEETRKIEYVAFNVLPTSKDSANLRQNIAELMEKFRDAENDSLFIEANDGILDDVYYKKNELSGTISDTIFKMAVGDVYGPYLDIDTYRAVKLLGKKVIPDSVKARHILIRAEDMNALVAAQKTIDSLKTLIETGAARFDSLAAHFSQDASNAQKGGDLGFFGPNMMVKPFNDLSFYTAEPGKVYSVVTQFGVHLVEVTDRKFSGSEPSARVAYISQEIIPSQETQDMVRENALIFQEKCKTIEDLRKNASAEGKTVETSAPLKANDYSLGALGANQASREVVRWVFGVDINVKAPKVGDLSPQVYGFQNPGEFYVSNYVVAALKSIRPAGVPTVADVKDEIEPMVINRKKGEIISQRIQGKTDLSSIAQTFSTQIDTATNITFAAAFLPKTGASEPKVVATALKTDLNQVSAPIVGNNGVYVVMPTNKPQPAPVANLAQFQASSQSTARNAARSLLMQALRKGADITDYRSKFF